MGVVCPQSSKMATLGKMNIVDTKHRSGSQSTQDSQSCWMSQGGSPPATSIQLQAQTIALLHLDKWSPSDSGFDQHHFR